MKKTNESHIVLFVTDPESDELVLEVLGKHYEKITKCNTLKELCRLLVNKEPKILLLSGDTLQNSLYNYYRAIEAISDYEKCDHRIVSLIPRKSEAEAYEAYNAKIIDDYMVSRPVYEIHRIVLICDHLLIELGIQFEVTHLSKATQHQQIESFKEPLRQSIKSRLNDIKLFDQQSKNRLSKLEVEIDTAISHIESDKPIHINIPELKMLLSSIRSDQMRVELLKLQSKTIHLLEHFIQPPPIGNETVPSDKPKEDYQFNRLYKQEVDADELLEQATQIPNILLVEDDIISMQLTKMLLRNYKTNVESVTNGRQAIELIKEKQFQLILMDVNLPDTNGIYLVDQIASEKGLNQDTPVIILSGNKNKSVVSKAMERGAKGYILKPLEKSTTDKIFKKFLNNKRSK